MYYILNITVQNLKLKKYFLQVFTKITRPPKNALRSSNSTARIINYVEQCKNPMRSYDKFAMTSV